MLQLKLITLKKTPLYTEGVLFNAGNNSYICDTLEDTIRFKTMQEEQDGEGLKILNETAIPGGRYKLTLHRSSKLGRFAVMLLNVPYFSYILMHFGKTVDNSSGCILCGKKDGAGLLVNTGMTDYLVALLQSELTEGTISITR
jgi:hypothetical protein